METLIQLLTDPENQPHQYVGEPQVLADLITRAKSDERFVSREDARAALDELDSSHKMMVDLLSDETEKTIRTLLHHAQERK